MNRRLLSFWASTLPLSYPATFLVSEDWKKKRELKRKLQKESFDRERDNNERAKELSVKKSGDSKEETEIWPLVKELMLANSQIISILNG